MRLLCILHRTQVNYAEHMPPYLLEKRQGNKLKAGVQREVESFAYTITAEAYLFEKST